MTAGSACTTCTFTHPTPTNAIDPPFPQQIRVKGVWLAIDNDRIDSFILSIGTHDRATVIW